MYKHKLLNSQKAVIEFTLSIIKSILSNSVFQNVGFTGNLDGQKNCIPRTIYKDSSQTSAIKINTKWDKYRNCQEKKNAINFQRNISKSGSKKGQQVISN